jgi:hypothetical protein
LKEERETQAACVLAVRVGNHLDNETSRLRFEKANSFGGNIETTWHLVNVRNATFNGADH